MKMESKMRRLSLSVALAALVVQVGGCATGRAGGAETAATKAQPTFTNPLLDSGPDPWITRHGDNYYYMHTLQDRLAIWKTRNIAALADVEPEVIFTPPEQGANAQSIWAPELHRIDGKWYVYYSAASSEGDEDQHRGVFVLENTAADPTTGQWIDRGKINTARAGIDGTTFEYGGQRYFVYSPYVGPDSVLAIAKMSNPWTLAGEEVILTRPNLPWERQGGRQIVEGPEFLLGPKGDMFLSYSASACWSDDYALGLLSAPAGSDPMDASAWIKSRKPVFAKSAQAGVYATGHNGFFTSPDGTESWFIYHANPGPDLQCTQKRSPRIQRIEWTSDGRPNFGTPSGPTKELAVPSLNK